MEHTCYAVFHQVALGIPEATRKMMAKNAAAIPLARAGQPDEAAGGVFALCIPEASYITGQSLRVIVVRLSLHC